uniref:Olfactory receptor n=1 Tax=Chrysemys picta bellii TaxID=8478 RepID=A0A8C3F583_CHRPI
MSILLPILYKKKMGNQTTMIKFLLLGFSDVRELQILHFAVFLVIYLAALLGNFIIITVVAVDHHLHTPMYFFLSNLSFIDLLYISVTVPKSMVNSLLLTGDRTISFSGCITQLYFSCSLAATECYLLAVMSYDRYLAICKPLHYSTLMNNRFRLQLAAGSWLNGCLASAVLILFISQLIFCGPNKIDHFYCDPIPLMELSCSDTHLSMLVDFILACVFTLPPFLLTLMSYVFILVSILRIPSTTGRQKAFSTCSSHLTVVTIFYGTIMTVHMLPKRDALRDLKKVLSFCFTVLTPLVNPLIYSLRNREVKEALSKAVNKYSFQQKTMQRL